MCECSGEVFSTSPQPAQPLRDGLWRGRWPPPGAGRRVLSPRPPSDPIQAFVVPSLVLAASHQTPLLRPPPWVWDWPVGGRGRREDP